MQSNARFEWHEQSGPGFLCWTLLLEAFVVKATEGSSFQCVRWGCFVYGFGVGPFSNHHHSSLDMSKTCGPCGETAKMSYCSLGCLFMSRWNMMYLQKEYTIHLAVVSHAPATPSGVSNIVKTESSPQMIYTPIVRFVFLANISDLLCLSRGELELCGPSALSEWVT